MKTGKYTLGSRGWKHIAESAVIEPIQKNTCSFTLVPGKGWKERGGVGVEYVLDIDLDLEFYEFENKEVYYKDFKEY